MFLFDDVCEVKLPIVLWLSWSLARVHGVAVEVKALESFYGSGLAEGGVLISTHSLTRRMRRER